MYNVLIKIMDMKARKVKVQYMQCVYKVLSDTAAT